MGRIVANFFISLDGVVEAPERWQFPYFDEQLGAVVSEGVAGTEAFLMGRRLYEEWSQYWTGPAPEAPEEDDDDEFREFINAVPKYVLSTTLTDPAWGDTTVLSAPQDVRDLKARVGGTISMSGSATVARWLLTHGLLDELNLLLHPIVVGHGQRLFTDDESPAPLRLAKHDALESGVLHLTYVPE